MIALLSFFPADLRQVENPWSSLTRRAEIDRILPVNLAAVARANRRWDLFGEYLKLSPQSDPVSWTCHPITLPFALLWIALAAISAQISGNAPPGGGEDRRPIISSFSSGSCSLASLSRPFKWSARSVI